MHTFKEIGYYWMNERTIAQYSSLSAIVEFILLIFPNLYMVEFEFSHCALFIK